MKRKFLFIFFFFVSIWLVSGGGAYADWWQRPTARPTQPSEPRPTSAEPSPASNPTGIPTSVPTGIIGQPTPTSPAGGNPTPTPTPRIGAPTGEHIANGDESSEDDPCAPGKPFTGAYCGWSPGVIDNSGDDPGTEDLSGSVSDNSKKLKVKGLSNTFSNEVDYTDILVFSGMLCLLLYAKTKLPGKKHA